MVAVGREGLCKDEEIGRFEEGAEIGKNKHTLGYPVTHPIPPNATFGSSYFKR